LFSELVGADFRKYFLVVENYQCLDSASESLTAALIEHLSPFVCFAITRKTAVTDQTGSTSKIQFLNGFPHMKSIWMRSLVIHLGSLPHEAIKEMICLRFEVKDVAESIVDAIAAKSNGVALFVSELTAALATTKFVHVVKGIVLSLQTLKVHPFQFSYCSLSGKLKLAAGYDPAQAMASLPTNVEDVIGARIDGLPPTEQMLVKVGFLNRLMFVLSIVSSLNYCSFGATGVCSRWCIFSNCASVLCISGSRLGNA
jgi:hypothetical protein